MVASYQSYQVSCVILKFDCQSVFDYDSIHRQLVPIQFLRYANSQAPLAGGQYMVQSSSVETMLNKFACLL